MRRCIGTGQRIGTGPGLALVAALLILPIACTQVEAGLRSFNGFEAIREADSPLIEGVSIDSGDVRILLSKGAGARQAWRVWCRLLIPNGLDGSNTILYSFDHSKTWPMPADC